jgi:hypothetical protein
LCLPPSSFSLPSLLLLLLLLHPPSSSLTPSENPKIEILETWVEYIFRRDSQEFADKRAEATSKRKREGEAAKEEGEGEGEGEGKKEGRKGRRKGEVGFEGIIDARVCAKYIEVLSMYVFEGEGRRKGEGREGREGREARETEGREDREGSEGREGREGEGREGRKGGREGREGGKGGIWRCRRREGRPRGRARRQEGITEQALNSLRAGETEKGLKFFMKYSQKGAIPQTNEAVPLYNSLIRAYYLAGSFSEALQVTSNFKSFKKYSKVFWKFCTGPRDHLLCRFYGNRP